MKKLIMSSLCICAFIFANTAMANTADGETPADEAVCDVLVDIDNSLFGLCNAYCEAMDCDADPYADQKACNKVGNKFAAKAGFPVPCLQSPLIDISKSIAECPMSGDCELTVEDGAIATYVFEIKNNGNVTLSDVELSDMVTMGGPGPDVSECGIIPALDPMGGSNDTFVCEIQTDVIEGIQADKATVSAVGPLGQEVMAMDEAEYTGTISQDLPLCCLNGISVNMFNTAFPETSSCMLDSETLNLNALGTDFYRVEANPQGPSPFCSAMIGDYSASQELTAVEARVCIAIFAILSSSDIIEACQ